MNAKQKIHQVKMTEWAALIREQSESNLTVKEWCNQNNYSIHKYNYWKHLLKEEAFNSVVPDIVPLSQPPAFSSILSDAVPAHVPVSLNSCNSHESKVTSTSSAFISIGDVRIEIGPSVSDEVILGMINVLRSV